MDEVFRAINAPSRRHLLDRLFEQDGQTLSELCAHLPEMTRFGVMSQLAVLEEAGLVTTRRQGRYKYHYLNPVPIKLISDRWISRFAELRVTALADLKARSEGGRTVEKPLQVYRTFIRATAEEVWDAIIDPDKTQQYYYNTRVESTWQVGSPLTYSYPDGRPASDGHIIAIDPPRRLEFTFRALWDEELTAEGPSREVWSLEEVNGMTVMTIEVLEAKEKTLKDFAEGFPYILSGLKSLLETGEPLPAPYVG